MTRTCLQLVLALACMAACSKSSATREACTQAADHVEQLMARAAHGDMGTGAVHIIVFDHCTKDAWSADGAACVTEVGSVDDLSGCNHALGEAALPLMVDITTQIREREKLEHDRFGGIDPNLASVVIEVDATSMVIGGKQITERELDRVFEAAFRRDRNTQVLIKATRDTQHARVVSIMERAKAAGLTRLSIGTI